MRRQLSQLEIASKLKTSSSSSKLSHLSEIPAIKKPDSTEDIINNAIDALQNPPEKDQESTTFMPLESSYVQQAETTYKLAPDSMKLNPNVRTFNDIELAPNISPNANIRIDSTPNKHISTDQSAEVFSEEISPKEYIKRSYTNLTGRNIGTDLKKLPGSISNITERTFDVIQSIPDPVLSGLSFAITLAQLHPSVRAVTWVVICGNAIVTTSVLQTILDVKEKEKPLSVGLIEHSLDAVAETNKYAATLIDMGSFLFDLTKYHIEENRKESSLYK